MHLLGLAPTGWLASPDNGARRRQSGDCMKPNHPVVPLHLPWMGWVPTYSIQYGKGVGLPHAYPLARVEKLQLGLLPFRSTIVLERSQLGMHSVGSMASAPYFGFSPKVQH
jgi:hypothetical protein